MGALSRASWVTGLFAACMVVSSSGGNWLMDAPRKSMIAGQVDTVVDACKIGWRVMRRRGPSNIQFWFIALIIGIAAGLAAVAFRHSVNWLQKTMYRADDVNLVQANAENLPWFAILAIPIVGGLVVGLILHRFTDDGRVRSVSDVIEGSAMHDGRVEVKQGLASALASAVTLGTGGSTGRDGPVWH